MDVQGGDMCGIILPNGRDCQGAVAPDSPLNLCAEHIRAAAVLAEMLELEPVPTAQPACPVCGYDGSVLPEKYSDHEQNHAPLVYYLRFGDRIKIGTTTNLERRLVVIPHDELLATEPGSFSVEHHRHRQFANLRLTGEWFTAAPQLLTFVESIRA